MSVEHFIISVYCFIAEIFDEVTNGEKLRKSGEPPAITDCEIITILLVGEYLGLGDDKAIWSHFKQHWQGWFPKLDCRTSFVRPFFVFLAANLIHVQGKIGFAALLINM